VDPRKLPPSPAHPSHGDGHTVALGHAGSQHPVSTSSADRTQSNSVAAADPHGDVKLSSSSGLTQEQVDESLATGHPGSDRPIVDSED
jgi:hypothetical protein